MAQRKKPSEYAGKILSSDSSDNKKYILVNWYLQQHGSFSSGGRSRDISLTEFSSTQQLKKHFIEYIEKNYQHVNIADKQYNVLELCQTAIDESNKLLISNKNEISRVTSRFIWPPSHKLMMGCLVDARIVATYHDKYTMDLQTENEEQENNDTNYCLITQLGNHPTHVQFVRGSTFLREEILHRFKHPFLTNSLPTKQQYDLFVEKSQALSLQNFCNYVTSQLWHECGDGNSLYGVIVDFIIAGEILLFMEPNI